MGVCAPHPHPLSLVPTFPSPPFFPLHPILLTDTSTQVTYEQLKARAAARHEAPAPSGSDQPPIRPEDEMDRDCPPGQGPLSPDSSGGHDETSHNDTDEAAANVDNILAAYNTTPRIVGQARAFTQVRNPHLSPLCPLTAVPSFG